MDDEYYKLIDWIPILGYQWYSERNNLDESSSIKPTEKARGLKSDLLFFYNSVSIPLIFLGTGFATMKCLEVLIKSNCFKFVLSRN